MDHSNILGVVLAGGKSQRFGEDKCQVKLGDKLLIDYILSEILDEFKEVLLISNNKIKYNYSNKISLVEDTKKGLGPIGGILTAMKWIRQNNKSYKWISTFPSDTPFFKKQILNNFLEEINNYEGKMYGFGEKINDEGIDNVLSYIKSYWADDIYQHQISMSK